MLATLALLILTSACASNARWTFYCTEMSYFEGSSGGSGGDGTGGSPLEGTSGGKEALGQLVMFGCCLLLLPIAVDVVCLPVAVPHDLWFRE